MILILFAALLPTQGKSEAAMENEGLVSRISLTCGLSLTPSPSNLAALAALLIISSLAFDQST